MVNPSLFLAGPMGLEPTPSGVTAEKQVSILMISITYETQGAAFLPYFAPYPHPISALYKGYGKNKTLREKCQRQL